jgi:hypothetical protein
VLATVLQPPNGVPAVVLDFTEDLAVDHHTGAPWAMMVQVDKTAVAVALAEVGPGARQDVRVEINLEHGTLHKAKIHEEHEEKENPIGSLAIDRYSVVFVFFVCFVDHPPG